MEGFVQRAMLWGPVILFSLTVHEFSHAYIAHKFGDDTARDQGRMSLNPLVHLDLVGTLAMVLSGFRFGWAKPVPVNPANLRNPRIADIWISAAGPISNIGLAIVSGLIHQLLTPSFGSINGGEYLDMVLRGGVFINVALALFNMIPVFPLDGSHILGQLLPRELRPAYNRFSQYAPFLLIIIVFTGLFWTVVGPVVTSVSAVLLGQA